VSPGCKKQLGACCVIPGDESEEQIYWNPNQPKYPLVICYIAIENGIFIVNFPIKNGDFP
jgi:hypothetical protein